jgi:hypothetical protein
MAIVQWPPVLRIISTSHANVSADYDPESKKWQLMIDGKVATRRKNIMSLIDATGEYIGETVKPTKPKAAKGKTANA